MERLGRDGGRLVVLGTQLPDARLPDVIRRIRAQPATRQISVLALIPAGEPESLDGEAFAAGANGVLRRPLERTHLEAWLAKLLSVARRSDVRVSVEGRVVGTPADPREHRFEGISRNLSVNGILFASEDRLPGADLDMELYLAESGRRIPLIGRVVREAREVAWPHRGYGVEFVFVPPDSLEALVALVNAGVPVGPGSTLTAGSLPAAIFATVVQSPWIFELVEPVPYPAGYIVEIRRARRDDWRPGEASPYYVVDGVSADAALRAAREFIARHR
jgi:hypothetical protein